MFNVLFTLMVILLVLEFVLIVSRSPETVFIFVLDKSQGMRVSKTFQCKIETREYDKKKLFLQVKASRKG